MLTTACALPLAVQEQAGAWSSQRYRTGTRGDATRRARPATTAYEGGKRR